MVRLEYSFPDVSPEGEGKGLWWGIFHTDLSPYLPIAILQEKWWEPVYLNKVDDYNQDALGYKEITLSLRNIDTKNNLIKAAAKSIIDQIVEKVLPVLTKISLQTQ